MSEKERDVGEKLLWEAEWRRNSLITLCQDHMHNTCKCCVDMGIFNPVSERGISCEDVLRSQKHLGLWGRSVPLGYREDSEKQHLLICSAPQVATEANRDLKQFGCYSLYTVTMKAKSIVLQLPPPRNPELFQQEAHSIMAETLSTCLFSFLLLFSALRRND